MDIFLNRQKHHHIENGHELLFDEKSFQKSQAEFSSNPFETKSMTFVWVENPSSEKK